MFLQRTGDSANRGFHSEKILMRRTGATQIRTIVEDQEVMQDAIISIPVHVVCCAVKAIWASARMLSASPGSNRTNPVAAIEAMPWVKMNIFI